MVKTALIVDDSRLARLTLRRLLGKYEIQVFEAEGVLDAEIWLSRNPLPDIVFMDIMMPELDGYEGLARLRAEPETRNLPVIMYSGDISDEARKKARDAGATGYLPKPADAGRLDHLLNALQERMRQEAASRPAPSAVPTPPPQHKPEAATITAPPSFNVNNVEEDFGLKKESPHMTETVTSFSQPVENTPSESPAPLVTPTVSGVSEEEGNEMRRRLDLLEKDISSLNTLLRSVEEQLSTALTSRKTTSEAEEDRHHQDILLLQNKITESEKQSKFALIVGGTGLFIGLLAFIWHLF